MEAIMALPSAEPSYFVRDEADGVVLAMTGAWVSEFAPPIEASADAIASDHKGQRVLFDLSGVTRLDTLGAWVLDRTRHTLGESGQPADFINARAEHRILLDEIAYRGFQPNIVPVRSSFVDFLADMGETVVSAGRDLVSGTSFLGEVMTAMVRVLLRPKNFRFPSLVHHLELIALRGLPIIALIAFLVGCIVTQQGIFQLQRFGATAFVVNLIGVLSLRELGVLLASIMVAGRSGSAFTAEIGSMKMREEIDALRVMGLDPIEVLIVPRMLALIIALPILTLVADFAAIAGGWLVAFIYGGISTEVFLNRLRNSVGMNTFLVGFIKAPFMAVVIGLIASIEGLAVKGSAESLGKQVTSSVVKAIFMVIVLDGLFAMFFASIKY
jgi:phospholipid/cholesterol/gamma-HCH transport system permease protein